jgi:hypothetical protein
VTCHLTDAVASCCWATPRGQDLPIGLYREGAAETGRAELVRQVGTVAVPTSQVATFTIPEALRSGLQPG